MTATKTFRVRLDDAGASAIKVGSRIAMGKARSVGTVVSKRVDERGRVHLGLRFDDDDTSALVSASTKRAGLGPKVVIDERGGLRVLLVGERMDSHAHAKRLDVVEVERLVGIARAISDAAREGKPVPALTPKDRETMLGQIERVDSRLGLAAPRGKHDVYVAALFDGAICFRDDEDGWPPVMQDRERLARLRASYEARAHEGAELARKSYESYGKAATEDEATARLKARLGSAYRLPASRVTTRTPDQVVEFGLDDEESHSE